MMTGRGGTFADFAARYRQQGFWPRPVVPRTKRPPMKDWQRPDPDWKAGDLDSWIHTYGHMGIGLVMGSPFPDGTRLAALDIDRDDYVRAAEALLPGATCKRFGAKGIVLLARLVGDGRYREFKVNGGGKIGELLCEKRFCVIAPTIHPNTAEPYRWVGLPLLEVDYRTLPLIEA